MINLYGAPKVLFTHDLIKNSNNHLGIWNSFVARIYVDDFSKEMIKLFPQMGFFVNLTHDL